MYIKENLIMIFALLFFFNKKFHLFISFILSYLFVSNLIILY